MSAAFTGCGEEERKTTPPQSDAQHQSDAVSKKVAELEQKLAAIDVEGAVKKAEDLVKHFEAQNPKEVREARLAVRAAKAALRSAVDGSPARAAAVVAVEEANKALEKAQSDLVTLGEAAAEQYRKTIAEAEAARAERIEKAEALVAVATMRLEELTQADRVATAAFNAESTDAVFENLTAARTARMSAEKELADATTNLNSEQAAAEAEFNAAEKQADHVIEPLVSSLVEGSQKAEKENQAKVAELEALGPIDEAAVAKAEEDLKAAQEHLNTIIAKFD